MEKQLKKVNASTLANEYINLTNLQRIAVSNMEDAFLTINADAGYFKPSVNVGKIYGYMIPRLDENNVRMVFSYMDDLGLLSDYDWDNMRRYFKEYKNAETN